MTQIVEPLFSSPSAHYMKEVKAHVFSIIKDGNVEQKFTLKVSNKSLLNAVVRVALPYNGINNSFLLYSVLPAKQVIKKNETKLFTIKIKIDMKKAGISKMDDIQSLLGMDLEDGKVGTPRISRFDSLMSSLDSDITTIMGLSILETSITIAIPVRIHYKPKKRVSKSMSIGG